MDDEKKLSKGKLFLIIGGGVILALPVILFAMFLWMWTFGSESTLRSDIPLSREEYIEHGGTALPKSAHNVYYLMYAGGLQDLESYLRFDVDLDEGEHWIEEEIKTNNTSLRRQLRYERLDIRQAPQWTPLKKFLPMPWWNPKEIQEGYYRGENASYAVNIWVDTEENRIYVYTND